MAESNCLKNCREDEPRFILCARDKLAPTLVHDWADRASVLGVPPEKVVGARAIAVEMQTWQQQNPELVKVPD